MSREAMQRTAKMMVEHCVALRAGEQVLVIGDTETAPIAEVLADAARAAGGDVVMAIMPVRAQHGNDPPPTLAAAMAAADVMLMAVRHSITHTTARKQASARGARSAILRSVTVESILVVNRPGGSGAVGWTEVLTKRGGPHGLTTVSGSFWTTPPVGQAPFKPADFTAVAGLALDTFLFVVRGESTRRLPILPDVPTFQELGYGSRSCCRAAAS